MALPCTASVLAPVPGFVMYKQLSDCLGLDYQGISLLDGAFDLDLPAMLSAMEQHQPAVIFLAYPNNPTGNLFSETSIREIIETSKGLVVIDETPCQSHSVLGTVSSSLQHAETCPKRHSIPGHEDIRVY